MRNRGEKKFKLEKAHQGPAVLLTGLQKTFPKCLVGTRRKVRRPGRKQIDLGCHPRITDAWGFCEAVVKVIIALIALGSNRRNWR